MTIQRSKRTDAVAAGTGYCARLAARAAWASGAAVVSRKSGNTHSSGGHDSPASDAAACDILLYAIALPQWSHSIPALVSALDGEILASAPHAGGLSLLMAAPGRIEADRFARELESAGVGGVRIEPIGSHAIRYELNEARGGVFAPGSP